MSRTEELEDFAAWVAYEVMSEDFEDGFFAEMACRKLHRLGFVEKDGDKWRGEERCRNDRNQT